MIRNAVGLASLALVVAGVWGWLGWQAGLIVAGLPPSAFFLYGEALKVRGDTNPEG